MWGMNILMSWDSLGVIKLQQLQKEACAYSQSSLGGSKKGFYQTSPVAEGRIMGEEVSTLGFTSISLVG